MKRILIIGGGFAGLSTARRLCGLGVDVEIILLDKKQHTDFLPMLPDCLGRDIRPDFLTFGIGDIAKKYGFQFINEEVISIELKENRIFTAKSELNYDYLVIACGSQTNFYGNENIRKCAYKLDDTGDAKKIIEALKEQEFNHHIIAGGGYTGIEVATNLRRFLINNKRQGKITIIERANSILGPLPEWMKVYVLDNLKILNIDVFTNSAIEKIEGRSVFLSAGRTFDNAMVIWTAGVKTPEFIKNLKEERSPQGRLRVDGYLRLKDNCFAAGDAAYFSYKNNYLRMAVYFALTQGECVAVNITRSIKGKRLIKYRTVDLGYIIPMANNKACGKILGLDFKGIIPVFMHYLMCIYRLYVVKNKFEITKNLMKGGN